MCGSDKSDPALHVVDRSGDVLEPVDPEDATCGQQLHKLEARSIEAGDPCEPNDIVIVMLRKKQNQLPGRGAEPRVPPAQRARGYGRHDVDPEPPLARDGARDRRPTPPQVSGDECREHAPGRSTLVGRADVTDDVDPGHLPRFRQDALKMIVQVEAYALATRTRRGAVAVGTLESSLMLGELVHFDRDQGAAAKAGAARVNQAGLG
jgi:hypothetical protein